MFLYISPQQSINTIFAKVELASFRAYSSLTNGVKMFLKAVFFLEFC